MNKAKTKLKFIFRGCSFRKRMLTIRKKPIEGIYNQCSAIKALIGTKLEKGIKNIMNHAIPKNIVRDFL